MSADNGIYIASFPKEENSTEREYRVIEAQSIDNLTYYPQSSPDEAYEIYSYFKDSLARATKEEAILYAHKIEDEILNSDFPIIEYGVCSLPDFPHSLAYYSTLSKLSEGFYDDFRRENPGSD